MNEMSLKTGDSKTLSSKSFSKQKEASYDGKNNEVLITVVMTGKMVNEEKKANGKGFWPKDAVVKGHSAFRTLLVSESDGEKYINWLDSYGCMWEKI